MKEIKNIFPVFSNSKLGGSGTEFLRRFSQTSTRVSIPLETWKMFSSS
jgi:hypothetical protein